MADLFISYRRDDKDVALSYAPEEEVIAAHVMDALQRSGWLVHETESGVDPTSSPAGSSGFGARAVIVLWSSHSVVSRRVLAHAERARTNDALLPVFIANVKSRPPFESLPSADLTAWTGDRL